MIRLYCAGGDGDVNIEHALRNHNDMFKHIYFIDNVVMKHYRMG